MATVELIDAREMSEDDVTFATSPSTIAFDWETGVRLWGKRDIMALSQNVYLSRPDGAMTWQSGSDDLIQASTGDWIATNVDPVTGDVQWEVELTQVDFTEASPRLLPGSVDIAILNSEGSWSLVDYQDGELITPGPDDMFACLTQGEPMSLPGYSVPTEDAMEYTVNRHYAGCHADGRRVTDPSALSMAAVIGGSAHWVPWDADIRGDERYSVERTYVIANETGVHAYRF